MPAAVNKLLRNAKAVGANVVVKRLDDIGMENAAHLIGKTGVVVAPVTTYHVGDTVDDPMWLVRFADGESYEFWTEELRWL